MRRHHLLQSLFVVLVALSVFAIATPLLACPTCKDGLSASENGFDLARGFGWSIIFMMSMPFTILGGIGGMFYWQVRSARQTAEQHSDNQS